MTKITMGKNKWWYSKKNPYQEQTETLLKRGNRRLNLLSKLWYIGQICTIPKYTKKEYTIFSGTGKKDIPDA